MYGENHSLVQNNSAVGGTDSIRGKLVAEGISQESDKLIAQSRRQRTASLQTGLEKVL